MNTNYKTVAQRVKALHKIARRIERLPTSEHFTCCIIQEALGREERDLYKWLYEPDARRIGHNDDVFVYHETELLTIIEPKSRNDLMREISGRRILCLLLFAELIRTGEIL